MCCPLNHANGKLLIQDIAIEEGKNNHKIYHVHGIYDRAPATLADRLSRFFQNLELLEKIAEIADELFHLFGTILQKNTTAPLYLTLRNLHHAAHHVEHVLHSFCFLGDLVRIASGKFVEYQEQENKQIDYLRTASRVCHAFSHFLSTASFLSEIQICTLSRFDKVFKYTAAFNALGYAIWTISLIYRRFQGNANEQFVSDLGIHLGGCIFELIPSLKTISTFVPHTALLNKVASIAGIIHAACVVQRLMPRDQEEIEGDFIASEDTPHESLSLLHEHHHDH